mmetsp:Transcript_5099/g.12223  ORF Transcript_5099/g.12223 Transcript_5099/m.12223 type:complete len:190 (-) Transcript_5099:65-634(-)
MASPSSDVGALLDQMEYEIIDLDTLWDDVEEFQEPIKTMGSPGRRPALAPRSSSPPSAQRYKSVSSVGSVDCASSHQTSTSAGSSMTHMSASMESQECKRVSFGNVQVRFIENETEGKLGRSPTCVAMAAFRMAVDDSRRSGSAADRPALGLPPFRMMPRNASESLEMPVADMQRGTSPGLVSWDALRF